MIAAAPTPPHPPRSRRSAAPRAPARPGGRCVRALGLATSLAALLAALLAAPALGSAAPGPAAEPFSDWLDGLGDSAERLGAGDAPGAVDAARRAQGALPGGAAGARASAAAGLALLAAGRHAEAEAPLRAALQGAEASALPALHLALGEVLLGSGRAVEAAAMLGKAAAPDQAGAGTAPRAPALERLARRARWLECQALVAAGLLPQAAAGLEALLRDAPGDEEARPGRLALAGVHRTLGKAGRAFALYRALALEEPERPEGTAALAALTRWRAAGGPVPEVGAEDRLARAERLLARGHHAEALAEVALAEAAHPPAAPGRSAVQRALVLLAQGHHAEAEALAAPLASGGSAPGVRRSATWILARAAARAGRTEEAVRRYAEVGALPGGFAGLPEGRWRDLADEATYLAAWLWYDAGRLADAAARLEAFARGHPSSRRVDDARWFAAWSRYRLGEQRAARRDLARLEGGPLADAALYWQGRLAASPAAARALYQRAARAGGDGWYAALAEARLRASAGAGAAAQERAPGGPPSPPDLAPLTPLALPDGAAGRRLAACGALLALGWREAARAELADLLRRRPAAGAAAPLAELAAFAGDADLPFRAARDLLGTTRRTARWLYPEPHPDLPRLAGLAGVDPDLLRAVVRRESAFRPDARSAAGAVGLTQLVPATARRLSALAGAPAEATPALQDPEASLALGAHYLALLVDRFRGLPAALAAYNAGPAPAAEWARARAGQPLDEWVETIPYKETRGYLKAVLAARLAYRRLSGLPPDLDPAAPVEAPGAGVTF